METIPEKRCPRCTKTKAASEFNRSSRFADGLQWWCRDCCREHYIGYRERAHQLSAARREAHPEIMAAYRIEHAERIRETATAYRLENAERVRGWRLAYRAAHPEKVREWDARKYVRSREHRIAKQAAWYEENRAAVAVWRAANRDSARRGAHKRKAREANATIFGKISFLEVRQRDRDMCWLCKKPVDDTTRSYDHAVALAKGGEHSTRNIRIAHRACNSRKRDRDVPHQRLLF